VGHWALEDLMTRRKKEDTKLREEGGEGRVKQTFGAWADKGGQSLRYVEGEERKRRMF